jgi:hypothetical protein
MSDALNDIKQDERIWAWEFQHFDPILFKWARDEIDIHEAHKRMLDTLGKDDMPTHRGYMEDTTPDKWLERFKNAIDDFEAGDDNAKNYLLFLRDKVLLNHKTES